MLFCFRIRRKHAHTYWQPAGLVCGFVSNNYLLAGHIGLEMSKEVRLADVRKSKRYFWAFVDSCISFGQRPLSVRAAECWGLVGFVCGKCARSSVHKLQHREMWFRSIGDRLSMQMTHWLTFRFGFYYPPRNMAERNESVVSSQLMLDWFLPECPHV